MVDWPVSLPTDVERDTYEEGFANTMIRSNMDTGKAKRRRRYTAAPKPLKVTKVLTEAQLDTFITFFEDTIAGGATKFNYTHPRTGATVEVAFVKTPDPARPFGVDQYKIVMDLEVLP